MNRTTMLDNLSTWQASPTNDLVNCKPINLFDRPFPDIYEKLHHDIWRRITRLHGTIVSLETIDAFPFDYFYGPMNGEFWHQVIDNFLDTAVILLTGIACDSGHDCHTLSRFKQQILQAPWKDHNQNPYFRILWRKPDSTVSKIILPNTYK